MRATILLIALAVVLAGVLLPQRAHVPLDPDEPAAADGSRTAGSARTIYDLEPLPGAFDEPRDESDDPSSYEVRIELYKPWRDRSRKQIAPLLGPADSSQCSDPTLKRLIEAVRLYYDVRGSQKKSFALTGPHARAALDREWSADFDADVDAFVRRAVRTGVLHKVEFPEHLYPEFTKVVVGTTEVGATCPKLKIEPRDEGLEGTEGLGAAVVGSPPTPGHAH